MVLAQADRVLHALDTLPGLTSPDGTQVERAQGRTRTDWAELAACTTPRKVHLGRSSCVAPRARRWGS
jgi:hypothetical protein